MDKKAKDPVALLRRGFYHYTNRRFREAKSCWERVARLQPGWAIAWYNLGLALRHLGKRSQALQMLQQALKQDPTFLDAYVERALLYEELGVSRKAMQEYHRALRSAPASPIVNYNLGSLLFDQGRYAEARLCFRQVLHVDPTHAPSHDYIGLIAGERNRSKQEIQAHERALLLEPWNAIFMNNLGYALLKRGALEKAQDCFDYAIHLDWTNDIAYYNRAHVCYLQRDIPGVIKNLALAIRHNPTQRTYLRNSKDFKEIRKLPSFRKLMVA